MINKLLEKLLSKLSRKKEVSPYINPDRDMKEFKKKAKSFPSMELNDIFLQPLEENLLTGDIILLDWLNNKDYLETPPSYFEYEFGINAIAHKDSLIKNNLLKYSSPSNSLSVLKVTELKNILRNNSLKVSGKKSELIGRIKENLDEDTYRNPNLRILELTNTGFDIVSKYKTLIWSHKNKSSDGIISPLNALSQSKEQMISREKLVTSVGYTKHKSMTLLGGADNYEFTATLDKNTCTKCGQADGIIFKSDELNMIPPLHDGCRCDITTRDMDESLLPISERWSRNPVTNKSEMIPYKSYPEWRNDLIQQYGENIFN
ncbi:minor capsid protein [Companilactobacillus allii]|uniref:SAP domain-containing protein n=1 Tax=Companilactobacillus allii TaxID=1847728 RepID=A0A1P8Q4A9_9LACO|nr:minor capsid protein [Companilactobacillus allii]APX72685.1 hypothetical protein BTM29_09040 [Companilactobacillus allii]USQ69791.1 minor capsid protein [Companilactobacillus allii]